MKLLALLFCFGYSAFALPNPAPREKSFDLIKCSAPKFGTIWASFGHVTRSDDSEPRYFFTEISLIDNSDTLSRARFWGPEEAEAAGAIAVVRQGGMRLEFSSKGEHHKVTLINSVRNDPNSFMGNWELVSANGDARSDQVACTAL